MKAYVITAGEYSDYGILHVTLDKEKAEKFCAYYNRRERSYEYACVEEYDLDDFEIDNDVEIIYEFCFIESRYHTNNICYYGVTCLKKDKQLNYIVEKSNVCIYVYLEENNRNKAEKIAQDMLAKYKAEQENL